MLRFFSHFSLFFLLFAISSAGVINVPADQPSIQAGIDAAADGDTVLVADSTYYENINFKGKAIIVASHYLIDDDPNHTSQTIIDGSQPSRADSASVVYFVSGEDSTSVLYGFTITNGSGTITKYTWENDVVAVRASGGIFCYNSGARISHNKIMNNHVPEYSTAAGGGVAGYPIGSTAHVIIENNHIVDNIVTGFEATGSGVDLTCNGTIENNDISFNTSKSTYANRIVFEGTNQCFGAIHCWTEATLPRTVMIKDNRITHNQTHGDYASKGGGMALVNLMNVKVMGNKILYNEINKYPLVSYGNNDGCGIYVRQVHGNSVIDGNIISHNSGHSRYTAGGGIALYESNISITNNIISDNSASTSSGGGIRSRTSSVQIINNTIVNNTAVTGGGIYAEAKRPVVLNTIIWGNQATFDPQVNAYISAQYSNVQGGVSGKENIKSNPLFADSLFHLSDSSKCIGAGADSIQISGKWYYAPSTDKDGNLRPNPAGTRPDIGACENELSEITAVVESGIPTPKRFALVQNYPNPFNPSTTIEFTLPKTEYVELKIFNILGKEVETLVSKNLNSGNHNYQFAAKNLASGVYYYQLVAGEVYRDMKKMLLVK